MEDLAVLHENAVALHSEEKQDMSNKLDRAMQLVSQEQSIITYRCKKPKEN